MKEHGFDVKTTALDNAVAWQTVANGQADGMVSAWLPNTHKTQWQKYGKSVDLLGPNLKGAKVGFVVPSYMNVNSIEDCSNTKLMFSTLPCRTGILGTLSPKGDTKPTENISGALPHSSKTKPGTLSPTRNSTL